MVWPRPWEGSMITYSRFAKICIHSWQKGAKRYPKNGSPWILHMFFHVSYFPLMISINYLCQDSDFFCLPVSGHKEHKVPWKHPQLKIQWDASWVPWLKCSIVRNQAFIPAKPKGIGMRSMKFSTESCNNKCSHCCFYFLIPEPSTTQRNGAR